MKINIQTGFGTTLLLILFIALKLCNVITWSWWWVLSPLWITLLVFLVVLMLGIGVITISAYLKNKKKAAK